MTKETIEPGEAIEAIQEAIEAIQVVVTLAEWQAFAQQMQEMITIIGNSICVFAQVIADRLYPTMRICIEVLMRCGFYWQLSRCIRHKRFAWWIAWHTPSWLIWKLPLSWVSWSDGYR